MKKKALFLDRDGVINVDHGYVFTREKFDFVDGVFDLVARAKNMRYLVVVVTNQAGIGRGYYTEDDFHALMEWVASQFEARGGGIDRIYFCPDHPEHGLGEYKKENSWRKPGPGMLLQAARDLEVDLAASLLVGDKASDVQAGISAGVGRMFYIGDQMSCEGAVKIAGLHEVLHHI